MNESPIYLTRYDHSRLRDLVSARSGPDATPHLDGELRRAVVLPEHARTPSTIVTVDSRVLLKDLLTGATREVVLALPGMGGDGDATVSVLEELGTALLGCSVGDVITVRETGRDTSMRLLRVVQSPVARAAARLPVN